MNLSLGLDASRQALYRPESVVPFEGVEEVPALAGEMGGDDPVLGWWLASFCHLAFHPDQRVRELSAPLGWELEVAVEAEGCRAVVVGNGACRVVAFCGTRVDELRNLRQDVDARRVEWEGTGSVHRGFLDAWSALRRGVRAAVGQDSRPLMMTGYSLGAAMALLAERELSPRVTVGFGVPRVGDPEFAATLDERPVFRYQNCCDAVGHLPPDAIGYRHGGELLFLSSTGRLVRRPDRGWMRRHQWLAAWRYGLTMPWLRRGTVLVRPLADHAIPNYTTRLRQLVANGAVS